MKHIDQEHASGGACHATALFFLLMFLMVASGFAQGSGFQTKNVFLVAIDGIRNNEAFETGNLYMPYLWDSLRSRGTIYTNFQNRGITVTNAGHSTLVSGVRQFLPNNSGIATPIRPKEPTMGEYYRKELGIPANKVYYISGKNTIWRYPISLYPGYGYDVAPTIVLGTSQDSVVWDSTRAIMDRDHPSLCYVLFAHVDAEGHTADTARYLRAIRVADSLVYELWNKIQADSVYRDQTTMIVTSDHGRHDDAHGGWQAHGDYCHGCRHIPFFAIGPDIKAGESMTLERDQIDILPTIAHLLGFSAPLAQGEVMSEMLIIPTGRTSVSSPMPPNGEEINLSSSSSMSRSPSFAMSGDALHVVYSEGSGLSHRVFYVQSRDGGIHWSSPRQIMAEAGMDYLETAIGVVGDTALVVAATGYQHFAVDSTDRWMLRTLRSTDEGTHWLYPERSDTLTNVGQKPSIATSGTCVSIALMNAYRIIVYKSSDGGTTFDSTVVHVANSESPACTMIDTTTYAVWHHLNSSQSPYWNVLFDAEPWQHGDRFLSANSTTSYSYDPSITHHDTTMLHVVFAHLADAGAGNNWAIMHERDTNRDGLFAEPITISSDRTCFSPVIRVSDNGLVHAIWTDYRLNRWSLFGTYSRDGGSTWCEPYPLTSSQSVILEPEFDVRGDTLDLVWQDYRDGNWEIYFKRMVATKSLSVSYASGWNLVSLSLDVSDYSVGTVFPASLTQAFAYESSGYTGTDSLDATIGYWVKMGGSMLVKMEGQPRCEDTIHVIPGWNLIGSISEPVEVASIVSVPPGIVTSQFYGYDGGYADAAVLHPGMGYWVKVEEQGEIVLSVLSASVSQGDRIRIVPGSDVPPLSPDDENPGVLRTFELFQNNPNPFNASTVIRYELPGTGNISLHVFNLLGQRVAALVDEVKQPGEYITRWDAGSLPSGVYFYRLSAGSFVMTRKMLLLR